ncbi:hypothetical protein FOXG_22400 [Fusarium oxysporum f. sp. lycopersici 4287]|uniref:Uncharacterized protein n=2 Tax=Fusarium oxysporum f. sp. lycopersici (strain 4287 / CBS 123668 / FGSC 9935 / NRRL 34936) TaxID=426428 RepID=A0A0J9W822_FUSO4|nr:hypothetical protein FOXG_22400 [Fusarium oxysporum f. sp. lycopersici 4287]KAJ9419045.1 hypothetical protein QL093DRAFT_2101182 [Fusarium oxysporum]KNB18855.1 hypothetical protein FOXG_22400 [Fusarium oxysporum f. sp. lycopersici 4287]
MTAQRGTKKLVIVRNDAPDADNIAAFMLLLQWAKNAPDVELVIIFEPRPVDFSLAILEPDDQKQLDRLLKRHFPELGNPLKIRLNGLLTEQAISQVTNLSEEDRALLSMAVKPSKSSLEDAKLHDSLMARRLDSELHASLMARDLARCLNELPGTSRSQAKVTILVDMDALSDTSPVNLKCHAQEQLFNRTPEEIKIRQWYKNRIKEADEKLQNSSIDVGCLDFRHLAERIMAAEGAMLTEGASFNLLRRLVDEPGVAAKIDCVVQAGTLDLAKNIFTNQFNIALDRESAAYVLDSSHLFRNFVAVPTHTSQSISFSFYKLEENGFFSLARWILCFNRGEDPFKVAEGNVTLAGQHRDATIKLPDLAMILLTFDFEAYPRETSKVEVQVVQGESLLFVQSESGILAFLPKDGHIYKTVDLVALLTSVHKGQFRINWVT